MAKPSQHFIIASAFGILSGLLRYVGWQATPAHEFYHPAWPALLSVALNYPASLPARWAAAVVPNDGLLGQMLPHFVFVVAVVALWLWMYAWLGNLFWDMPLGIAPKVGFILLALAFGVFLGLEWNETHYRLAFGLSAAILCWSVALGGLAFFSLVSYSRRRFQ
jgi:hypothetical protein